MKKERAAALVAKSKTVKPKDAVSKCMPPSTQELAINVDEVKDVVALMTEQASSKVVSTSVSLSGVKVSVY